MCRQLFERFKLGSCVLASALLALAQDARAQDEPAQPAEPSARAAEVTADGASGEEVQSDAVPKDEKKKKKKKDERSAAEKRAIATTPAGTFGLKGRVLTELRLRRAHRVIVDAAGMPQPTEVDSFDIALDSARFSVLYQAPVRWLQAEIETEVSDPDQVELKDVYALATGNGLSAKVGNFKPSTSAIDLESAWTLPIASRGFVNDLLEGWLAVGGRRPGVQLAYEHPDGIEPKLILGAFQGSVLIEQVGDDRDLELIEDTSFDAQSWVARAQIELWKIDVGVFFEHRVGSPAPLETRHYPVTGADLTFDEEYGELGLRAWLDAHFGESWYLHESAPATADDPWFLAARAILAARYGGSSDDMPYGEVYVSLGMLDPDLDSVSDWAWDFAGGFNFGLWDRARLTLEAYSTDTSRNFPQSYFGGPRGQVLGLRLQAGVAF